MIEHWVPAVSSYAGDIDYIFDVIFWIVIAFWFLLVEGVFVGLILYWRKKPGVKAQYITGETKTQHRFIAWPHYLIMACDVVIVVIAIRVWYNVKQDLPPADETVRIVA